MIATTLILGALTLLVFIDDEKSNSTSSHP